jgi:site-specific recombinase XerD
LAKKQYKYPRATETYNGKRYEATGKTQREAERRLAQKIAAAKSGYVGSDMKVSTWVNEWLTEYIKPRVRAPGALKLNGTMSENSYRTYDIVTRLHIIPYIGDMRLASVTDTDLRGILNAQKGMSYAHAQKIRMVLKAMFTQAHASRLIMFNPAVKLDLPAVEKGSRRSFTPYEKEIFFKVAKKHRSGYLFRFMMATGMRPNEVRALRVRQLDLGKAIVKIDDAVEAGTAMISTPKTDAGVRHTVINDIDLISRLRDIVANKQPDDFLFPKYGSNAMMTDQNIHTYWRSFARLMDIEMGAVLIHNHIPDEKDLKYDGTPLYPDPEDPSKPLNGHRLKDDISLYTLRHTFCTDMQRLGVPVEVTKYLMGHEDISTTSNIYTDSGEPEAIRATKYIFPVVESVGESK